MDYKDILRGLEKRLLIARSVYLEDILQGDVVEVTSIDIPFKVIAKRVYRVVYADNKYNTIERPGLQKPAGIYVTEVNFDLEKSCYVSLDFNKTIVFLSYHLYESHWVATLVESNDRVK